MKRTKTMSLVLAVTLATGNWAIALKASSQSPTNSAGSHVIVELEGQVLLKRNRWQTYQRTTVGTKLESDDLLRVPKGAKVIVLCADLTTWRVPDGRTSGASNGCPPARTAGFYNGNAIDPPRSDRSLRIVTSIPYIISPRRTLLLENKPTFRWNKVPGATSYTVRLQSSGRDIWQSSVNGTEIVYPGVPALKSGVYYSLIVETAGGASSLDERVAEEGFWLLNAESTQRLQTEIQKLDRPELSKEAAALAEIQIYLKYGLFTEAIDKLESLAKGSFESANLYLMLGDRYWQAGLIPLAENNYLRASELSKAAEDLEGQAAAAYALGKIYVSIENYSEASRWFAQGQAGYEALGDSQHARELAQLLETLKNARKD